MICAHPQLSTQFVFFCTYLVGVKSLKAVGATDVEVEDFGDSEGTYRVFSYMECTDICKHHTSLQ